MTRYWSGLIAGAAVVATVGLGAQAPQGQNPANTPPADAAAQPGSQRTPPAPSAEARTPNSITVSGCLANAPAATASANPGAAGPGSATTMSYVLNRATTTASGEASRGAVGTSGTAATSYRLEGDTSMLSPHVDHRVQISGRLQSSAASATGADKAAPGSTAMSPTLRVESVTMLSTTCDAADATQNEGPNAAPPSPAGAKPVAPTQPQ